MLFGRALADCTLYPAKLALHSADETAAIIKSPSLLSQLASWWCECVYGMDWTGFFSS